MKNKFKIGQRIKTVDEGQIVFGYVIGVSETLVVIKWDDISYSCQHEVDEWENLEIIKK